MKIGDELPISEDPAVKEAALKADPYENPSTGSTVAGADATEPTEPVATQPGWLSRIMTADTGEGEVEDYLDHPLNFNKSRWLARILRGLTGMFGNLRKALVDIGVGSIEGLNEARKARAAAGPDA